MKRGALLPGKKSLAKHLVTHLGAFTICAQQKYSSSRLGTSMSDLISRKKKDEKIRNGTRNTGHGCKHEIWKNRTNKISSDN
jgi:hypothetical protein